MVDTTPVAVINDKLHIFLIVDYSNLIEITPDIRFGRPCVKGTRISVYDVQGWTAAGMTVEDIIEDFPELSEEDIKACLEYSS